MTSTLGRFRLPAPQLYLIAGASLGGLLFLRHVSSSLRADKFKTLLSPRETFLLGLSQDELKKLPYPPDALPGARDVDSPYGSIRVYEWGPEDGEKILLIHGISTPSIALADLAHKLVEKGCRVMLFGTLGLPRVILYHRYMHKFGFKNFKTRYGLSSTASTAPTKKIQKRHQICRVKPCLARVEMAMRVH